MNDLTLTSPKLQPWSAITEHSYNLSIKILNLIIINDVIYYYTMFIKGKVRNMGLVNDIKLRSSVYSIPHEHQNSIFSDLDIMAPTMHEPMTT